MDGEAESFAAELRRATEAAHVAAENAPFARELVAGARSLVDYTALLGQLEHVYYALELPTATLKPDRLVGPFADTRLHRLCALRNDMAALGAAPAAALPATEAYVTRITESAAWGPTWVAHHYTRYLGDLSGGLLMAKALRRAFGADVESGLTFFRFDGIGAPGAYKAAYRQRLDALGEQLSRDERARVVTEACAAFAHNHALFVALETLDGART